ncbi:helix-turn-helix transcriptional regulator [Rhodobacteraceae bacterium RKSG542]|uniref:helix-turn-helix transcriptional regulator n=1 Tax=Pseudovibrio flavus TaxID=2529854 RepID=UPI0012BCFC53|nr:LuxR C-terminal-related transcriptional regulator [Pseudovibrio flavus]MTI16138.1 helix-turn-helix transcriptional regulator [Pseudovibrio flavus]
MHGGKQEKARETQQKLLASLRSKTHALARSIVEGDQQLIIVNAPAGSGKTELIKTIAHLSDGTDEPWADDVSTHSAGSHHHWSERKDLPFVFMDLDRAEDGALAESLITSTRKRIIITRRPAWDLPWCDRLVLYGKAQAVNYEDLSLSEEEMRKALGAIEGRRAFADNAGWPWLVARQGERAPDDIVLVRFLKAFFFAEAGIEELSLLKLILERPEGLESQSVSLFHLHEFELKFRPLVQLHKHKLDWGVPSLRSAAAVAIDQCIKTQDSESVHTISSRILRQIDLVPEAIRELQAADHMHEAAELFSQYGGPFFLHRYGREKMEPVLRGFPHSVTHEEVVSARALLATKTGDVVRGLKLLCDVWGERYNDLTHVISSPERYSVIQRSVRLLLATYEDHLVEDEALAKMNSLVADIPTTKHLLRGSFYNSMLELQMRTGDLAEASRLSKWAFHHYEQAGIPAMLFYVRVHQCVIALKQGDTIRAEEAQTSADALLKNFGYATDFEERVNSLLACCIAYEKGDSRPLLDFLATDMEAFKLDGIWPSLADIAIYFGAQIINRHYTLNAARNYLESWRQTHWRAPHFRFNITMRRIELLQNNGRWLEASHHLNSVQSRVNRTWVEGALHDLGLLSDPKEIAVAMAWMRHIAFERPKRPLLLRQLDCFLANYNLTTNQHRMLSSVKVFIARRQKHTTLASTTLMQVLTEAARSGSIGSLYEDIVFLEEPIADRHIRTFLLSSGQLRGVLDSLSNANPISAPSKTNADLLTRMERRVLMLISEGASNKFAATRLGLSEATVKFHLKNTYKKLGCNKRADAVSAARALGLLSAG